MVQVSAEPCSPSALLRRWGLRPDLDALLVTTVSHNGSCYVGASPPAASAVTGNDLLRLADDQRVAPQLRACFLDATPPIPCSTRHTGEFVGDWQEDDGSGHVAECEDAAVRYIGRTIELDSPIQSVVLGGPAGYRCAVTSTTALTGTVRQLGGADLPTDDAG